MPWRRLSNGFFNPTTALFAATAFSCSDGKLSSGARRKTGRAVAAATRVLAVAAVQAAASSFVVSTFDDGLLSVASQNARNLALRRIAQMIRKNDQQAYWGWRHEHSDALLKIDIH